MKYLDLAIANEQIKTTDIKGKEYAEVNQRIKAFRMVYPQGTIETEMLSNENGIVIFKASVYIPMYEVNNFTKDVLSFSSKQLLATGTAYEKEDSSFINKTSYIENCETSAVGRALGMAGFGIDVSVASAEEVQNAIANQEVTQEEADNYVMDFGKHKGKKLTELPTEYLEWLLGNTKNDRMLKIIELATGLVPPAEEEIDLLSKFEELVITTETNRDDIYEHFNVNSSKELTKEQLETAIEIMRKKVK